MTLDDGELMKLAAAIADGVDIDWDPADSPRSTEDAALVRQLQVLSQVARVHRSSTPTSAAGKPDSWGPLEIREEIGRGSFGIVYLAWDPLLDREVALKILTGASDATASRVINEARVLAQLHHPNVVTIFGADEFDQRVGLWMEYIQGRTLKQILQSQGVFSAREATLIGVDLCHALAAVHRAGFVHRDVKAQNVIRETGGRIVLMDFGAAAAPAHSGDSGGITGTPLYLAPEVLSGGLPTTRSDLYSVGVLLYHLVSGEFPVFAQSLEELSAAHARRTPRRLRDIRPDLPAPFVAVIDAVIAADPQERPDSAGALEALFVSALGLASVRARDPIRTQTDENASAPPEGARPSQHYAMTRDGLRIVYAVHGSGPPLIFVRGWVSHLDFMWNDSRFRAFMNCLGSSFTVYRYDSRGNGLSERAVKRIDLDSLLLDLEAVLEQIPSDDFVLYGSTFGGPIAVTYAARHPHRVRRLILEGSYAAGKAIASKARQMFVINALRVFPEAAFLLLSYATNPGPDHSPYRRPELMHQMITPAMAAQFYALGFSVDVSTDAASLQMPTLVLHRTESHSIPFRLGKELASLIPAARFVPLRGAAHNLWEGDATAALREIDSFLDTRAGAARAGAEP